MLQPILVEPGEKVVIEESKEKAKGHGDAKPEKNVRDQSKADKEESKKGTATPPSKHARSSSTTVGIAMYQKHPVYRVA